MGISRREAVIGGAAVVAGTVAGGAAGKKDRKDNPEKYKKGKVETTKSSQEKK